MTVQSFTIYGGETTTVIAPNEQKQIYWNDFMARFTDDTYTCTNEFESLDIMVTNEKTLLIDIMNSGFWERGRKGGRNSREDCSLTISDEDLKCLTC